MVMKGDGHGSTTASVNTLRREPVEDPTPGLVLVYSGLHAHLPSAQPFDTRQTTLGRESDNTLAIVEAAVSRHHACITRSPSGCVIQDLGSTNGTQVDGVTIREQRLAPHARVRVGDTLFRFAPDNAYAYGPYRIDGTVVAPARRLRHSRSQTLIGGYQMDHLVGLIDRIGATPLSVVVHGESGTGKELVARELHSRSGRSGPFQAINCAALPANLLESELFGYKKGAFTGATSDKTGLIRAAHGGTLFLDEIGDMPLEAQAKLLRVLQQREVLPIGATTPTPVDVRVVCATHRDLDERVAQELFRGDLLARLRDVALRIPPLRHRLEDLYPLLRHFLRQAGRTDLEPTFPFMECLAHYQWPYNVRELESAIKLAVALSDGHSLQANTLPPTIQAAAVTVNAPPPAAVAPKKPRATKPSESELRALLIEHRGNIAAVGRALGKERMQIHRWAKRYGLDLNSFRD